MSPRPYKLLIFDWEGTLASHQNPHVLFDGTFSVLERLRAQGYLLAIATGKSKSGLKEALRFHHLSPLISATCTADESMQKPNPAMLFNILENLAIVAQNALMIGDTIYDMDMARAAHMPALAVSYGLHSAKILLQSGGQGPINNIIELPQWLLEKEYEHA